MNLKEILKEHGYEIVAHIGMEILRIKFTEEELEERLKKKELYDYDITGMYDVKVAEVGFNGHGNLYIVLDSIGDEHFEEGDCFDVVGDEEEGREGRNETN